MTDITSVLHQTRVFPPSEEFVAQANVSGMAAYEALMNEAKSDLGRLYVSGSKCLTEKKSS